MKEKRNFKKEIKEWWDENKKAIKAGVVCGFIGICYGFAKGLTTSDKMWMGSLNNVFVKDTDAEPCDELGLTESNCDDPEMADLVRFENENA